MRVNFILSGVIIDTAYLEDIIMKFWTIQTKDVIEQIQEKGIYQPDFSFSRYLKTNEKLGDLYSVTLRSFNQINKKNLPGIIFAFAKSDNYRTINE